MTRPCAGIALSPQQIKCIFDISEKHSKGSFELFDDEISGRRVLVLVVDEYPPDAVSQMDAYRYKYVITQTFLGSDLVATAVEI